jgi:hypothetical protein
MSALEHPLVTGYLSELDATLARLPAGIATELAEQIRAHLEEALPPDADDQTVATVLAALGPASLVAEAAGPEAGSGRDAISREPLRRRIAKSARKVPITGWLVIAALCIAIGLPSGTVIYWRTQSSLQFLTTSAWWSRSDWAHEVDTQAAGATQTTVPIRPGQIQGFAITVYNPSDMTQVIVASADHISPGAPVPPQIAVSTTGTLRQSGEPHWVRYRIGGPIPPHSYRWVRVLWRSWYCYLNGVGSGQGTSDLRLGVRVGLITRTEDVQLPMELAVGVFASGPHPASCGSQAVPHP